MNETTKKKSWTDGFSIRDRESCAIAIRNGGIAALISATLTAAFGFASFLGKSGNESLDYFLDPWVLVDAAIMLVLGIFVFRKSRVASTLLVIYFVLAKVVMWLSLERFQGLLLSLVFLAYYVTAMRGTYLWHSRYADPQSERPRVSMLARVVVGIAAGIVVTFLGFVAYGLLYTGPQLSLRVNAPESVAAGEPFQIELQLTNPHPEAITLDSVDIDESVFEIFEVTSVTPAPSEESPLSVLGQRSWVFDRIVHPGGSETVVFELQAPSPGTFQVPLQVCNGYQDCSGTPISVRVE
jgi:hypothetical protein